MFEITICDLKHDWTWWPENLALCLHRTRSGHAGKCVEHPHSHPDKCGRHTSGVDCVGVDLFCASFVDVSISTAFFCAQSTNSLTAQNHSAPTPIPEFAQNVHTPILKTEVSNASVHREPHRIQTPCLFVIARSPRRCSLDIVSTVLCSVIASSRTSRNDKCDGGLARYATI